MAIINFHQIHISPEIKRDQLCCKKLISSKHKHLLLQFFCPFAVADLIQLTENVAEIISFLLQQMKILCNLFYRYWILDQYRAATKEEDNPANSARCCHGSSSRNVCPILGSGTIKMWRRSWTRTKDNIFFISGVSAVLHSWSRLVSNSQKNKASRFNSLPGRETGSFCHSWALKLAALYLHNKGSSSKSGQLGSAGQEAELLCHTFLTKRKMCCVPAALQRFQSQILLLQRITREGQFKAKQVSPAEITLQTQTHRTLQQEVQLTFTRNNNSFNG